MKMSGEIFPTLDFNIFGSILSFRILIILAVGVTGDFYLYTFLYFLYFPTEISLPLSSENVKVI